MDFQNWIQDVMYHMVMAKLNESSLSGDSSGNGILRVMRNNDIDLQGMHEHGVEAYEVPDLIREDGCMYLNPR